MKEKLTLVLFKDHQNARTFELPLHRIERTGILYVLVIFLTLLSSAFMVRAAYRMWSAKSEGSVEKVQSLQHELTEVRASYQALQAHLSGQSSSSPGSANGSLRSILFTSIPSQSLRSPLPSRESLSFRLEPLKFRWQGNFLQVSTAIEYRKGDEGNQQGNFFIVAQGPQNLYAHPEGAFSEAGQEVLMDPESGEYFSVSRYREIRARFGPVERHDQIQSLQLFMFDKNKNLIYFDRISLKDLDHAAGAPTGPIAPKRATAPKAPSGDDAPAAAEAPSAEVPSKETTHDEGSDSGNNE
ncbi:MAG: hypothetical protein EOP09_04225 [Proteobacteria bacterium]|nr:MAG: hypothetical protein EOP09_04225 [Pseudomonadota bacterium]